VSAQSFFRRRRRLARGSARPQSRTFITAASFNLAKKAMPKMSETEKIALGAGTVGFDRDIFGGSPSLKHLVDTYQPKLSAEEQSFLDNEVDQLCVLLDDHQVTTTKDMTAEAWDFMRCVDETRTNRRARKRTPGSSAADHATTCAGTRAFSP
jgi:acyl-CoA dehydrogenase